MSTVSSRDNANSSNANADAEANRNSNDLSAYEFQLNECDDSYTNGGNATLNATNGGGFITQPDYILNEDDEGNSIGSKECHYFECNTEEGAAAPNEGNQNGCGGLGKLGRSFNPLQKTPPSQEFSAPENSDVHTDNSLSCDKDEMNTKHNDSNNRDEETKDVADTSFVKKLSSLLRPPREEKSPVKKPPFHFEQSITHVLAGEINQRLGIVGAKADLEELRNSFSSMEKTTKTYDFVGKKSESEISAGEKTNSSKKINGNRNQIENIINDSTSIDTSTSFTKKLSSPLRPPPEEPSPVKRPPFHFEESITHVLAGEINERLKPRKLEDKQVRGEDCIEHETIKNGALVNSKEEVGGCEKSESNNMENSGSVEDEERNDGKYVKSEGESAHDTVTTAENIDHLPKDKNEYSHHDENDLTLDTSIDHENIDIDENEAFQTMTNPDRDAKGDDRIDEDGDMEHKVREREAFERKRSILHLMDAKLRAICRASIHLNDNSTSFLYSPRCVDKDASQIILKRGTMMEKGEKKEDEDLNGGHNVGLPYIGPSLRENYLELRSLLKDGLLGVSETDDQFDNRDSQPTQGNGAPRRRTKGNVSALLMGPRGSGKSLVLERCLADLSRMAARQRRFEHRQSELKGSSPKLQGKPSNPTPVFRVVRINGMLYQGDNTIIIAREIARQLNEMSRDDGRKQLTAITPNKAKRKKGTRKSRRKKMRQENVEDSKKNANDQCQIENGHNNGRCADTTTLPEERPLHTESSREIYDENSMGPKYRKSAFTSNIALFDDALRTARLDGIPILIILDDIDTFISRAKNITTSNSGVATLIGGEQSSERQLLLYHLLDRVADHKFLVSLVGLTSRLDTYNNLEKRVQSRAEGTTKNLYFPSCASYDEMVESLLGKFYAPFEENLEMTRLREEAKAIMLGCNLLQRGMDLPHLLAEEGNAKINDNSLIRKILERNFCLGRDFRWFCRVLDITLSFMANDINAAKHIFVHSSDFNNKNDIVKPLSPIHFAKALVATEASQGNVFQSIGLPSISSQGTSELKRLGEMIGNHNHYALKVGNDSRMRALLDLTEPQIAVLLAARRIMARDDRRSTIEENALDEAGNVLTEIAPLTYQRIQDEYTSSFNANARYTIASYPIHEIRRAFIDLMEIGLIRIKKERSGGGPFQFEHSDALCLGADFSTIPIFINHDWPNEFLGLLKAGMLHCSTALREWGLKMN
mmetsp:Transcript_5318/g.11326  ORF Transcript_5318/g.11326 Transcript_5318/m.11326 type:complete len:1218 (+) Transcript_5318:64-3717(+)